VSRELDSKARALAGIKGYVTNIDAGPECVIDAYHRLFNVEKSFRMSKSDLAARPIYHHKRDSIEAHLTIVFAALAVSRWIEDTTGWSIKKFVRTTRRYRTIEIQAGLHTITAADPLPDDLREILRSLHDRDGAH
jgi:transposase